ncbi:MAG: putative DNA binding domain-containing protein [Prevotella histicola]|jgi:putative transcriptional regulator|uniref:RNA-binding domain-containing protein n=1 Tax=Prevotella TaxID=838 RepID=UPI00241F64D4|nr:RNA-binding domain-containing protein [Prevotella histicola]MBS5897794.1 putative DNA binding domain-containing protein [Prevotella histicola]
MKKYTKLSMQWFYSLLEKGECDIMDFKEQLEDKRAFGKSHKNFAPNYEEMARDVVAFANLKGGFLFVGIVDGTKEVNQDFKYDNQKVFDLIKQVQDRTFPTITLIPHTLKVDGCDLLLLEIPFSSQMHRTSRGEFLIRSNDGNRPIEPYEMSTILAEKGMIVYDQQTWKVGKDWIDQKRLARLRNLIEAKNAESPYLDKTDEDLLDSLGMIREDNDGILPTTTGLLFIGNDRALRELPYYQVKYIHYFSDGTYRPYEYKGNIVEVAEGCFNQLKAEIKQKEFVFGLFREYVEDYSEIVIRELLINALAHRDISRQQIIEIRKYDDGGYLEIESPGTFPEGVTVDNYLRKTNPRNPNVMDILREIGLAEKAGSGFDKIFTDLLKKGKALPMPEETETSVIFRIKAEVKTEKLIELSLLYENKAGRSLKLDQLFVLSEIVKRGKVTLAELAETPNISQYRLQTILDNLQELGFVESTGKTSGLVYILHVSKRKSTEDKIDYVKRKKQNKARQKEAILRYLDSIDTINNTEARELLKLQEKDRSMVSRLFAELVQEKEIEQTEDSIPNNVRYKRVQK